MGLHNSTCSASLLVALDKGAMILIEIRQILLEVRNVHKTNTFL